MRNKKPTQTQNKKTTKTKKSKSSLLGLTGLSGKDGEGGFSFAITPERIAIYALGGVAFYVVGKEVVKRLNGTENNNASSTQKSGVNNLVSNSQTIKVRIPPARVFPLKKNLNYSSHVKQAQELLMRAGYSLPRFGADGKFGNETLAAVRKAFGRDIITRKDFIELANEAYKDEATNYLTIKSSPSSETDTLLSGIDWVDFGATGSDENEANVSELAGLASTGTRSCGCTAGHSSSSSLGNLQAEGRTVRAFENTILIYKDEDGSKDVIDIPAGTYLGKEVRSYYDSEIEGNLSSIITEDGILVQVPTQNLAYY